MAFLFFFGSMFFTFATIGMVPRLRLTHQLDRILSEGTPWDLVLRLVPYAGCLLTSWVAGLAVLRVWGDLNFPGSLISFMFIQVFVVMTVGMLSLLFGWTAANPGIASSRMILFIPGGFILGGATGPVSFYQDWVVSLSHIFPLTWEFHFTRDLISRGAGLMDISREIGAFMLYMAVVAVLFCWRFYSAKKAMRKRVAGESRHREKVRQAVTGN
jgi:ABC-2 type transport system permease protein